MILYLGTQEHPMAKNKKAKKKAKAKVKKAAKKKVAKKAPKKMAAKKKGKAVKAKAKAKPKKKTAAKVQAKATTQKKVSAKLKTPASKKMTGKPETTGNTLKGLYTPPPASPNLEFEKQFESEIESFDESKHSVPGAQPTEEEEEDFVPEPTKDEDLFDYDDEDLEY